MSNELNDELVEKLYQVKQIVRPSEIRWIVRPSKARSNLSVEVRLKYDQLYGFMFIYYHD